MKVTIFALLFAGLYATATPGDATCEGLVDGKEIELVLLKDYHNAPPSGIELYVDGKKQLTFGGVTAGNVVVLENDKGEPQFSNGYAAAIDSNGFVHIRYIETEGGEAIFAEVSLSVPRKNISVSKKEFACQF